ncbi:Ca-activated chloride channel family protein [Haloferula luteola]|uniref:Ca-activated chloride channel family protein n=1 Tax=Haloferula luteola TaxID=595692 RepID=A0A840VCV1_9BACT|nr:von Willebrand factor type A domain-containing protein [Haloferula luteola]MBB5352458.1 Ca-activated chloride channel family protein [Haloferula luteola]
MKHEDDLMDALLKEQSKGRAVDDALLASIEKALDGDGVSSPRRWIWRFGGAVAAAAAVMLVVNLLTAHRRVPDGQGLAWEAHPGAGDGSARTPSSAAAPLQPQSASAARPPEIEAERRLPAPEMALRSTQSQDLMRSTQGLEMGSAPMMQKMSGPREAPGSDLGRSSDGSWRTPWEHPLSSFPVNVETGSYSVIRQAIFEGRPVRPEMVRIESCINAFQYGDPEPKDGQVMALSTQLATCPWDPEHRLLRVSLRGKDVVNVKRPPSNWVFLVDVSGWNQGMPSWAWLKTSMEKLIGALDDRDRMGIVMDAGREEVSLESTRLDSDGKAKAVGALASLGAGRGGAGSEEEALARAYRMARESSVDGGVTRVVLATSVDSDASESPLGAWVEAIKRHPDEKVDLTVLTFGSHLLDDAMSDAVALVEDGQYHAVKDEREAEAIFLQKLSEVEVPLAKEVTTQLEFNPAKVESYRLIGGLNRTLRHDDAFEEGARMGNLVAGDSVTVFYEWVPVKGEGPDATAELRYQKSATRREVVESSEWFTLKVGYQLPEGSSRWQMESTGVGDPIPWEDAGRDFRLGAAVAAFGMKLQGMSEVDEWSWEQVEDLVGGETNQESDEQQEDFLKLIRRLGESGR